MTKVDVTGDGPAPPNLPQARQNPSSIEARSLSALTAIASNPPAYPRNPTQKKDDPLALYIVRVPGSRDVFLSTLKPPTKSSVSAEAINAALYYLHVATPGDEALLREVEIEREEEMKLRREMGEEEGRGRGDDEADPDFVRLNNVRRKPVGGDGLGQGDETPSTAPTAPTAPLHERPAEPLDQPGPIHRRPVAHTSTDTSCPPPLPQRPPRRPLPPVPTEEPWLERPSRAHSVKGLSRLSALPGYLNSRGLENLKENWKEKYEALAAGRHSLDSRPVSFAHGRPADSSGRSSRQSPIRKSLESRPSESSGFHITLIRRDPTHDIQWNVGTMSTPRMDGSPIDIEISTPGYKRFAAQDGPLDAGKLISLSGLKLPQSELCAPTASGQQQSGPRKFHRQLRVSRPYHEDPRGSMDALPRSSTDDGSSGFSRLKSGYYTFSSPWNGTCTFATSVNGRSLKCKHMVPSPNTNHQLPPNAAVTVAELRFNTPFQAGHLSRQPSANHASPFALSQIHPFHQPSSTDLSSPSQTSSGGMPGANSKRGSLVQMLNPNVYTRHNHLGRPRSRSNPSNYHHGVPLMSSAGSADVDDGHTQVFDVEERMDLSLAREPAGGGMRGKDAKLGKLVVEDEGIKMLDLVVAACMAVWWKGYYY